MPLDLYKLPNGSLWLKPRARQTKSQKARQECIGEQMRGRKFATREEQQSAFKEAVKVCRKQD